MEQKYKALSLREIKKMVANIRQNNKNLVDLSFPTAILDARA